MAITETHHLQNPSPHKPPTRLTLHASLIRMFLLLTVASVFTGCGRMTSPVIPRTLNTDALIIKAGHSQGAILTTDSNETSWDTRFSSIERRFSMTFASGTSGQLLTAYRREIERTIIDSGGSIHGTGIRDTEDNIRDFSYEYTHGKNDGIVRVYSFTGASNQIQIILFCCEHLQ